MASNVNLAELAKLAKNYTGAELESLVKNASSFAMTKGNDIMDFSKEMEIKAGTSINQKDFYKALEEITPGFGIDQANF